MFETLAPYIIAGLMVASFYMFNRWLDAVNYGRRWKDAALGFENVIDGMRREGCAAMGALENIFNGVTAGGMPHSKLVKRVADVATEAILDTTGCQHKDEAEDFSNEVECLAGELMVCRQNLLNWQAVANSAEVRAEDAERLLGMVSNKLMVERSERDNG